MQYLYEKLQRHNLVTMPPAGRAAGRRDLGFRHSCGNSVRACEFMQKADGVSDDGLRQAIGITDREFQ
jgi:hypothetical protein